MVLDYAYGTTSFVMPNVLAKLGAEVLAVNPYASTAGVLSFDRQASAARVAELVRASGAHLGAVLDPDGEHADPRRRRGPRAHRQRGPAGPVDPGHRSQLLGDRVALPVSASRGGRGDLPDGRAPRSSWTKLSAPHLMDVAAPSRVGFAASQSGGFIFPAFLPAFDAAATLVKLLDLLARHGPQLSELVAGLPTVHIAHEGCVTPWEQKGTVMRSLVEQPRTASWCWSTG